MSTFVTRRAAFGIAATAVLASLTACASDIRPLSDPSTPEEQRSYKGELKFNSYESRGTYVPATSSKKAENPPKPINQYQTSQNVSFIFRIPKDFKIKPYLCIRFGDVSTFRICIKGNSVIESEAVPATVKPV